MTTATRDPEAARRLRHEIELHRLPDGREPSILALHDATGLSRPALTNWLSKGVQPDRDGMQRIADALGVQVDRLWLRWLNVPLPDDALVRIAEALERAYPPTPPLEELVAQGEALTARAGRQSLPRGVAPKRRSTDS